MSEHPILFSGPMVRAISEGRKTQTRRVMRPQPLSETDSLRPPVFGSGIWWAASSRQVNGGVEYTPLGSDQQHKWRCPYGNPGDLLWVRETWAKRYKDAERYPEDGIMYRADGGCIVQPQWKPSIHMPRWASRLTLRITDVRVQRLQEITEGDCEAEGVDLQDWGGLAYQGSTWTDERNETFDKNKAAFGMRGSFAALWDSINAERAPWPSNPWVWALTFEKATT